MSSDLQTDWRCYCFACHRSFIVSHPFTWCPVSTQCPYCKIVFGEIERVYKDWTGINYTSGFRNLRKHKKERREWGLVEGSNEAHTPEYCIVPWLYAPKPQIIPTREFHEMWLRLKDKWKKESERSAI